MYTIKEIQNTRKPGSLIEELNTGLMMKMDNIIDSFVSFIESLVTKKARGMEVFVDIMMKISIAKLAISLVMLILMTILLLSHLHSFDPITLHFSKWASSPLIGFILLIVTVKFIGISIGLTLTILTVRKTTLKEVLLRLKNSYILRLRIQIFFRKKAQPQIN